MHRGCWKYRLVGAMLGGVMITAPAAAQSPACPNWLVPPAAVASPAQRAAEGSSTPAVPPTETATPELGDESSFAAAGTSVAVADTNTGYIDSALIRNQLRFRYDASYRLTHPDRAEFFWPQRRPVGPGPLFAERSVDYQDVTAYLETKLSDCVSVFVETPTRFLNPEINPNTAGFADMNFGARAAFWQTCDTTATFQLRIYAPTGDADRGLGNHHFSVEPALLVNHQLASCWTLEAEVRDWVPIDGTDYAGNVLRYGVGVSYKAHDDGCHRVSPVAEVVAWSVLDGQTANILPSGQVVTAGAATTIVNAKLGVRAGNDRGDIYLGYGRALTGTTWYEDTFRFELRIWY